MLRNILPTARCLGKASACVNICSASLSTGGSTDRYFLGCPTAQKRGLPPEVSKFPDLELDLVEGDEARAKRKLQATLSFGREARGYNGGSIRETSLGNSY
jgi:hypothetical protein